jgi:hypothetical protein
MVYRFGFPVDKRGSTLAVVCVDAGGFEIFLLTEIQ